MNIDTKPLPKQRQRSPHTLPWLVVSAMVIVALVMSAVLVRVLRTEEPAAAPEPAPEKPNVQPIAPSEPVEEEPEEDPNAAPEVTVGDTYALRITQWELEVHMSGKLRGSYYELIGDPPRAIITNPLIDSLPEECADMRRQFGFERHEDNTFTVMKPENTCEADTALYNEIWGLLDAAAKTVQPL